MDLKKYKSPQFALALMLFLLIGCNHNEGSIISQSEAKLPQKQTSQPKPSQRFRKTRTPLKLVQDPNISAPSRREGGDTRDASCPNDIKKPPLTFLIPKVNMGLTVSDHPTFWFYSPYAANSQTPVVLKVIDSQEKEVFKQEFELANTPGVIGLKLPKNAPALENNKSYDVILSINCASRIDAVRLRIKRIQPNTEVRKQLQANKGRDRAIVFGENGFWFDMLTQLIELRRQNPQDEELKIDWEELLKSDEVDLDKIVPELVVFCCKFK
ncbi:DUF928 domain-containing protein [Aetokthonos hydrillicola Thurmond2011]|jgi:hypothetical protein|uniref:DUF928 domain-containing protein n=1 Tax=Aetokthonos hydrillicola Thurmond2011 TaxID=2712845 RepID=A0AAP5IBJ8_9CYAN|nr:DUF928 domain-containing protein [Aetokthonos hydrillicola]MBO3462001.1 DUF928 domain-containing protein [Aetokthonos hydrillicola CCALA 1050]MBW4584296.1 DUF928 domain-containing protein [Aetokthonos hydrillicola CCALA 1050]MDR9898496.1 DUF928 domain-containing protein [Aetokthonos hydrillicola Thurmond2011]